MRWKTAWSYLPVNYNTSIGTVENITQRTVFRNNLSGTKVKIKFSNIFSCKPLVLDTVVIAKKDRESGKIYDEKPITSGGSKKIIVGPEKELYSDELDFMLRQSDDIVISVYVKEKTDIFSVCSTWSAKCWKTRYGLGGNFTHEQEFEETESIDVFPVLKSDPHKADELFGITGILVYTDDKVKTVSLFGDSITHMSYYSDALTERLYNLYPEKIVVLNRGLGGNRLLHDYSHAPEIPGGGTIFGDAGVKRFCHDVYGSEEPDFVIVLIGINDFMHPYAFGHINEVITDKEYENGILQLVKYAHENSSKIFIGTVMPFKHEPNDWFEKAEHQRQKANKWIRCQTEADGIIDFDAAVRKPENPEYMLDGCHLGDGLHPNTDGGIRMADAVPAEWFK